MTIEVHPLGFRCNIACRYCYQEPCRQGPEAGGDPQYDLDAMKRALLDEGAPFTIFGGEPLLIPFEDLADLVRWGAEHFSGSGRAPVAIQTNGTLLTDAHLKLFKRYGVAVGLSIDGPDELNDARWAGSLEATREATRRSLDALDRLLAAGLTASVICTLSRANASPERLPRLLAWLEDLRARGIRHVNLHALEVDSEDVRAELALSEDELAEAWLAAARLDRADFAVQPIRDLRALLRRKDDYALCIWRGCDPWTTPAVRGIDGQGHRMNCGRTYKDGIVMLKADQPGFERYIALYQTPQAYGGCAGCRFFLICRANCPGTAERGDWRGKTEHCRAIVRVLEALEAELVASGEVPLSLAPDRIALERWIVEGWQRGEARRLAAWSGPASTGQTGDHLDIPHLDTPHDDHDDLALLRRG